jgi:hypothetical protein
MASREKLLTFAALFAAAVSSIATSALGWTLGDEESGEVVVDGNDQVVRLQVHSSIAAQIRVEAEADTPAGKRLEPPVVILVSPRVAYRAAAAADAGTDPGSDPLNLKLDSRTRMAVNLGGIPCESNCEQEVELHFKREGAPAPMRVHWVVKAGISGYESNNGEDPPDGAYVDVTKGS